MSFLKDIYHLFFPKVCVNCNSQLYDNENTLCLSCNFELPLTEFTNEENNKVEKAFYGRIKVEFATSLLFYSHGSITQKLIYQLKYYKDQSVGTYLGEWLGKELVESERFPKVDCIVPVPLHPKKMRKRGYNQLTKFGEAISETINVPFIENVLIRKSTSQTQTKKNRFERWKNVIEIFDVTNRSVLDNKHILLIDDVITTGATLEACALELLKSKNVKISITTMAFTE